jgi:hypothetical protein
LARNDAFSYHWFRGDTNIFYRDGLDLFGPVRAGNAGLAPFPFCKTISCQDRDKQKEIPKPFKKSAIIFRQGDTDNLPDGLHPDGDGYETLGARFAKYEFGAEGRLLAGRYAQAQL